MLINMENETCRDEQRNKVQSKVMLILLSAHCCIQHMSLLCCIVVYLYMKKEISALCHYPTCILRNFSEFQIMRRIFQLSLKKFFLSEISISVLESNFGYVESMIYIYIYL